jgi:fructokinase
VYAHPNEHNEVIYDIVKPVAWDFIEWKNDYAKMVAEADYFIFGSLAARSPVSKKTLFQLIESAKHKVLDINLRAPHYDQSIVEELLGKTNFLKLNLAELELITGWFADYKHTDDRIRSLAERFGLPAIVVTMGGDGATFYMAGQLYKHPGFAVKVKDTVGSGDAFLAGLLSKLMDKEHPGNALTYANALGAFIATQTGACPSYTTESVAELVKQHP